jgi:hypothetical protein
MVSRRQLLAAIGVTALAPFVPAVASAGVARALKLEELVKRSAHILRATPLQAWSEWTRIGDQRRIVTYTRMRVDDAFAGAAEPELLVRTLGGTVDKVGQLVPDEAQLLLGEPCIGFMMPYADGVLGLTGMAQGHYPLKADASGLLRLSPTAQISKLLDDKASAVSRLSGRSVSEASELIKRVQRP